MCRRPNCVSKPSDEEYVMFKAVFKTVSNNNNCCSILAYFPNFSDFMVLVG